MTVASGTRLKHVRLVSIRNKLLKKWPFLATGWSLQSYRHWAHISKNKSSYFGSWIFTARWTLQAFFVWESKNGTPSETYGIYRCCFVVVDPTDSMAAGQSCIRQSCKQTSLALSSSDFIVPQLGNVVVCLCGTSGNTLYRVLLLVY
jgi:hypothetical protein